MPFKAVAVLVLAKNRKGLYDETRVLFNRPNFNDHFICTGKKTVCSMVINSADEINAFKSALSPNAFDFVELTQNKKDSADWFRNSCAAKIQSDILVISGHFAGTFFGESGLNLPINDLESASCRSECDGILKRPKEVFLFGCNTLAGKKADQLD